MPDYRPNQPEYYSPITDEYKTYNHILGDGVQCTEEEFSVAHENKENLMAFYISRMPYKPVSAEKRQEMLKQYPFVNKVPKKEQAHRRQLSENAREAIADLAARKFFANGASRYSKDRTLRLLMMDDPSENGMEFNDKMADIIEHGTREDIGREMTRRVNEAMEVFDEMVYQEHSDEWLVENFEKVARFHEMAVNAQKFKSYITDPASNERGAVVSPKTLENILKLERISNRADILTCRLKMIAHAEYEHIDMAPLVTMDEKQYEKLEKFFEEETDVSPTLSQKHIGSVVGWMRWNQPLAKRNCVMEIVADDFGKDFEKAQLTFVNNANEIQRTGCSFSVNDNALNDNLNKGYVVARTDDMVCCYRLDINGSLCRMKTSDLLNDLAPAMRDVLGEVEQANKGFFFGSKEYSDALKAMRDLNKLVENAPKPLAGDDNLKNQFQTTMVACKAYMDKKNPDGSDFDEIQFKNDRERERYEAMEKAFNFCKNGLSQIDLQAEAKAAKMKVTLGGEGEAKIVKNQDVFAKINNAYGGAVPGNALAESNVGTIADELRADINESLSRMVKINKFDKDEAQETFSNMVLLEIIKQGRSMDASGNPVAGDVEKALAAKPESVVRAIRDNAYVKAVTENLDVDMLRQFVMTDRAKTLADRLTQVSKEYAPENKGNELHKQNEQEIQSRVEGPKLEI